MNTAVPSTDWDKAAMAAVRVPTEVPGVFTGPETAEQEHSAAATSARQIPGNNERPLHRPQDEGRESEDEQATLEPVRVPVEAQRRPGARRMRVGPRITDPMRQRRRRTHRRESASEESFRLTGSFYRTRFMTAEPESPGAGEDTDSDEVKRQSTSGSASIPPRQNPSRMIYRECTCVPGEANPWQHLSAGGMLHGPKRTRAE